MRTVEEIKKIMSVKGYRWYDNNKPYNINLIGIRNIGQPNSFDDEFYIIYRDENSRLNQKCYQITTDPGTYWLKNPMNVDGTGIMVEGQYLKLWKKGFHKGDYPALVQYSPVSLYRDSDKDGQLDMDRKTIATGIFGVNCHHAGSNSIQVDKWSAACQVFAKMKEWNEFMSIIDKSLEYYPDGIFSYTLLNNNDFK